MSDQMTPVEIFTEATWEIEMLVFLGILIVGFIWIWKKGALEWV